MSEHKLDLDSAISHEADKLRERTLKAVARHVNSLKLSAEIAIEKHAKIYAEAKSLNTPSEFEDFVNKHKINTTFYLGE